MGKIGGVLVAMALSLTAVATLAQDDSHMDEGHTMRDEDHMMGQGHIMDDENQGMMKEGQHGPGMMHDGEANKSMMHDDKPTGTDDQSEQ